MSPFSILSLSVALAMDATAVAAARGMSRPVITPREVLRVALFFGGFQALMPLLGWLLGQQAGPMVVEWDHWIAFGLLGALGGKMLWESRGDEEEDEAPREDSLKLLLVLAIATSIDAFAVGLTLPMLGAPFVGTLLSIGVTTALLSGAGLFLGRRFGARLGKRFERAGGVVLILIGTKILIEHLSA